MTYTAVLENDAPAPARALNVIAKGGLIVLLAIALASPDTAHLRDKAAGLRAVGYPIASFAVPLLWWRYAQDRTGFPWLADLLVTLTCFTDILGNRLDLYDTIAWFDDWMHFMNTGLLAGAFLLLTLDRSAGRSRAVERALAFGATAAIAWELAEYVAFIAGSTERRFAYADTLGDLALGTTGAVVAAVVVHSLWRRRDADDKAPFPLPE
ncbi:hypothetical protein [Nocardioides sp. SYSU DS0663]|uniref:hypothetical protein n=1 Tax=Nocardioides sp. SYSU DS0663 TaxID=3416445 RepID=UPI003F4B5009